MLGLSHTNLSTERSIGKDKSFAESFLNFHICVGRHRRHARAGAFVECLHRFNLSPTPLTIRFAHRKFSACLAHETLSPVCDCGCGRTGDVRERRDPIPSKTTPATQSSRKPECSGKRRSAIGAHSRESGCSGYAGRVWRLPVPAL